MRFEPFTDAAFADPYPQYAALRATDPVHWSDKLRAWILFRYDDVVAVLRDDVRFTADRRRAARAGSNAQAPSGLRTVSSDAPDGAEARALLHAALAPRVRTLGPRITAIVDELADAMSSRDEVDLATEFAHPLPVRVIADLLDVPAAERERFHELSRAIARGMDRLYGATDVSSGLQEIGAWFLGLVSTRTDGDGDDLVRRLLTAEHRGDRLTTLEVVAMCSALVFGGNETTGNLIANGMLDLFSNPTELERLRADPSLVPSAVEELVRYDTPPQFISRVVAEPCELGGKALERGASMLLGLASANRDPAAFAEPDRLDVGRAPNPHVGWGVGTHFCPGAQLARMEARAAIGALVTRFPDMALAGAPERRRTLVLRGLDRLPVRLGRAR